MAIAEAPFAIPGRVAQAGWSGLKSPWFMRGFASS